jgi:predicted ATPase
MTPSLTGLTLKRFRSIPAATVTFDNPTFLVGKNGSGKSNLVDAFAFLAEAMVTPLQSVIDGRGGITAVRNKSSGSGPGFPPNLALGVEIGQLNGEIRSAKYAFEIHALPNYGFEVAREQCVVFRKSGERVWFDRKANTFLSSPGKLDPAIERNALVMPLVGGDARFHPVIKFLSGMRVYSIVPSILKEMQDPDSGMTLRADGRNAASVLQEIERQSPTKWERVCEILETIVPNTKRVQAKKHGNKVSLEFTQEWANGQKPKSNKFEAFSMSDGTLRALGLLTAIYQRNPPSVVVVEEPEATIHPGALGAILDLVRQASKTMQVVVTTHSPELLDAAKWIKDANLRVVVWEKGASRFAELSESGKEAIRSHLMGAGELLRANAIHAAPPKTFDDNVEQPSLFEGELA